MIEWCMGDAMAVNTPSPPSRIQPVSQTLPWSNPSLMQDWAPPVLNKTPRVLPRSRVIVPHPQGTTLGEEPPNADRTVFADSTDLVVVDDLSFDLDEDFFGLHEVVEAPEENDQLGESNVIVQNENSFRTLRMQPKGQTLLEHKRKVDESWTRRKRVSAPWLQNATEVRILCKWYSNVILELIISYVTKCIGGGKGRG
jgi:hypothetical protein